MSGVQYSSVCLVCVNAHDMHTTDHKDVKLIQATEWRLDGLPEGHDEADGGEGTLAS